MQPARLPFRCQLAKAFRRPPAQRAADGRPLLIDGAEKIELAGCLAAHVQRRAMSVAHLHERAVAQEMGQPFRGRAEPFPVVARHAHKRRRGRKAADSAAPAVGGRVHVGGRWPARNNAMACRRVV